jgi:RNA-directed DNA polymerase
MGKPAATDRPYLPSLSHSFTLDVVVGFEHEDDAIRFRAELGERLHKFSLDFHADKTRLIEFGRFAAERRARKGQGKPETFNFLGFTHICGQARSGRFLLIRHSSRRRRRAKLREVRDEIMRRRHLSIKKQGLWLGAVVRDYLNYPRSRLTSMRSSNSASR